MKLISLFVGRFQPLHNGHFIMMKKIAASSSKMIIGIGSAQEKNKPENPLSAEERVEMISRVLKEANIKNAKIILIPDIHNDKKWVDHVKKIVGKFDIVHSGNQLVIDLFNEKDIAVHIIKEIDPFKATKIRNAICIGKSIKKDIPKTVFIYLKEINALERIKNVCIPQ